MLQVYLQAGKEPRHGGVQAHPDTHETQGCDLKGIKPPVAAHCASYPSAV